TSTDASVYVLLVAPMMFAQFDPFESQRRHWKANVIGWVPDHVPGSAVSVSPWRVLPETAGRTVFCGGVGAAAADPMPTSESTAIAKRIFRIRDTSLRRSEERGVGKEGRSGGRWGH